jgi:hypothetical protein
VIDPLIHETLSGRIDSWHYFWEHDPIQTRHLRLRVLWHSGDGGEGRTAWGSYLDEAEASGRLWRIPAVSQQRALLEEVAGDA